MKKFNDLYDDDFSSFQPRKQKIKSKPKQESFIEFKESFNQKKKSKNVYFK